MGLKKYIRYGHPDIERKKISRKRNSTPQGQGRECGSGEWTREPCSIVTSMGYGAKFTWIWVPALPPTGVTLDIR